MDELNCKLDVLGENLHTTNTPNGFTHPNLYTPDKN